MVEQAVLGGTWGLAAAEGGEVGGGHRVDVPGLLHGAHLGGARGSMVVNTGRSSAVVYYT